MNHILHLLVTLFSCGLWAFVWFILTISDNPRFHCSQCGATPEFQRAVKEPSAIGKWFHNLINTFKATAFGAWYFKLNLILKIIVGYLSILVAAAVVGGFLGLIDGAINGFGKRQMNANSTSNSSSNTMTASPTPIVYPAGLSPAENLEKGKKALTDGDKRTAWNHLFEIKKGAKEFASAKQLLASIGEREQIEFELAQLNEREENINRIRSGLAYKVKPAELKQMLDNYEKQDKQIYARRQELNRKLEKMPR